MAFAAYIKFDGIDGEATDSKHIKWIDVASFGWGMAHHRDNIGAAHSSGKVKVDEFTFAKLTDQSSPKLALACCNGEHIKSAELHIAQQTGDHLTWNQYKFTDVLISGFHVNGHGDQTDRPNENVSISFSKYEIKYQPTDNKGALGGAVQVGFDLRTNKKV